MPLVPYILFLRIPKALFFYLNIIILLLMGLKEIVETAHPKFKLSYLIDQSNENSKI